MIRSALAAADGGVPERRRRAPASFGNLWCTGRPAMLATADLALKRGHAIDDARTTDPDAIFLPVRFGECAAGLARVMRVRSDATVERSAPRTVIV